MSNDTENMDIANIGTRQCVQTSTWKERTIIEQFYLKIYGFPDRDPMLPD
jgi:hypothetical protein